MSQRDTVDNPGLALPAVTWFRWACVVAAVVAIPGGLVVPWDGLHIRVAASAVTFVAAGALVLFITSRATFPQAARTLSNGAIGSWFVLNVFLAAIARDIDSLALGLGLSAIASVPFLIVAALASRREES